MDSGSGLVPSAHKEVVVKSHYRKGFSRIAVVFAVLLSVSLAWAQSTQIPSARFLIISDAGGFASADQKAVAAAMGKEAERIKAQFVVTAGDNYHGDGIASATDPRWKVEIEDVYSAPALQIPWYPSLGNHDYRGNPGCEIEYSQISPRWKLTSRYYAQKERVDDSTSILIVHLDTSPFVERYQQESSTYKVNGQDTKRQLAWLDSVLTATQVRWTIVVGHHPVYSAAPKHGDTKELIDQVLPLLESHKVPLYVCGHDHNLQHLKHAAQNFVLCGGGAEHRPVLQRDDVVFGVESLGFASVTVTATELKLNLIDANNVVLHTVQIQALAAGK
jgi:tartrate-resistant acid phosphatase type 5